MSVEPSGQNVPEAQAVGAAALEGQKVPAAQIVAFRAPPWHQWPTGQGTPSGLEPAGQKEPGRAVQLLQEELLPAPAQLKVAGGQSVGLTEPAGQK